MISTPYKDNLVDLRTHPSEAAQLFSYGGTLPSVRISQRELCDLEMIATGAFSPLRTFMCAADYKSVLETMDCVITGRNLTENDTKSPGATE